MTTSIAIFCCFENEKKNSCVLCRNFISIYKIKGTFHGRLGIRIFSSRAESISHSFASLTRERYFQHSKVKFVYPSGHVMFGFLVPFFGPIVSLIFVRSFVRFFVRIFVDLLPLFLSVFFPISCFDLCPVFCLVLCPDIRHRTSHIEIGHRASDVGHHTSDSEHRTSNIGFRTTDVGHQTWDITM